VGCGVLFWMWCCTSVLDALGIMYSFDCIEMRWLRREDGMDGGEGEESAVLEEYSTQYQIRRISELIWLIWMGEIRIDYECCYKSRNFDYLSTI